MASSGCVFSQKCGSGGEELQKQLEIWKTGFERKGQKNSGLFSTGTSWIEGEHVTVFKYLHDYKEEGNNLFSMAMK